ncbi:MAG: tRNA (N(6)-L-threonylcarbamoyladenosine(37)-C(2))-methylthiotransferase MtaB, partial [Methylococcales bacterium]|nr:tRNA (N(6)-L-threonylcarbamoyladenosine(37)-C(2))-methylthiotransferase MtaB [Methylococcales bacterium]
MKVYLTTLGCRLNEAELETWAQGFKARGMALAKTPDSGDILVLNSCAVTGEAARKSRQQIRRLHQANPKAKLVVTGCYATLNESEAQDLLGVDLIVVNRGK